MSLQHSVALSVTFPPDISFDSRHRNGFSRLLLGDSFLVCLGIGLALFEKRGLHFEERAFAQPLEFMQRIVFTE
jgi:hypothetical protein